ncbi:MAG: peptidylprolyl isomerase [Odoribacteraceae bacterium]|jgi:peptidylprolyl isomerase/peptidyl-prolyl cis-trans isomerase B (cyclophilin B)|nr:peptidylprolyl isomerase [Odoribacteraceae bacterium]
MKMKKIILALCCAGLFVACREQGVPGTVVELTTSLGKIKIRLGDETPLHRDNFVKLVEGRVLDSVLFHRVIKGFMVQAGDPSSRHAAPGAHLGETSHGETIPAEIVPGLFHKRGALAAARLGDQQNPERASSGSQFYIVQGEVFSPGELEEVVRRVNESRRGEIYRSLVQGRAAELERLGTANDPAALDALDREINTALDSLFETRKLTLTDEQARAYTTGGGAPHLDGAYTVFGEVIGGMEVIDKIADAPVDAYNRPLSDARVLEARIIR